MTTRPAPRWYPISSRLILLGALISSGATAAQAEPRLGDVLGRPGSTLFMRHMPADWSGAGETSHCGGGAPLSDEGRADAQAVALALAALKIEISAVHAGGSCRMIETGRVLHGQARLSRHVGAGPLSVQRAAIEAIVREPSRGLKIVVGDYGVIQGWLGQTLAEGESVMLDLHDGNIRTGARITLEMWRDAVTVVAGAGAPRRF